jgi:hypothetical protein
MKRLVPFALLLAALSGCAFRAAVPGASLGVALPGGYGRYPGYYRGGYGRYAGYYRPAGWGRWQPAAYWQGRPGCD